jgi:hypothetical protein
MPYMYYARVSLGGSSFSEHKSTRDLVYKERDLDISKGWLPLLVQAASQERAKGLCICAPHWPTNLKQNFRYSPRPFSLNTPPPPPPLFPSSRCSLSSFFAFSFFFQQYTSTRRHQPMQASRSRA